MIYYRIVFKKNIARPESEGEYEVDSNPYQGTLIRELRRGIGQSINVFAKRLRIHHASLSKIEVNRTKPSKGLLSRIANELGVPVEELLLAPLHPRIKVTRYPSRTVSLLNIGDRIEEVISDAHLSPDRQKLAEELILDMSRSIVSRLGASDPSGFIS